MRPLYLLGMQGLGDNFYQRPVLQHLAQSHDIYLQTPWPQLYADMPVKCVPSNTRLRTQAKNAARPGLVWHTAPRGVPPIRWHYSGRGGSMLSSLCDAVGVRPQGLDMSGPPVAPADRGRIPYIVVRPATIRAEWRADSRGPDPEYLARAVEALRGRYRVVSVADLSPGLEWALNPLPYADETYHAGELNIEALLSLVAGAAGVVSGVGWALPVSLAYRVPLLLIYGGQGGYNSPDRILDPRLDASTVHQVMPDNFCRCIDPKHVCNKHISNFEGQINAFLAR